MNPYLLLGRKARPEAGFCKKNASHIYPHYAVQQKPQIGRVEAYREVVSISLYSGA